jgi:hypothetical protein
VVKESALVEEKMRSLGTDITTSPSAHQEIEQPLPTRLEDKVLGDVNFPMTDYTDNLGDYEDDGFYNPELDNMDFPGYTSTYTKEQKFEIILLKLCTEMETPLYAFEEIMKWAREAYKDGYEFLPYQKTYHTQIDNLKNGWVWKPLDQKK